MAIELDDIDLLLLTELQADADRTNVELARLAGLSPAATLNRVRRLKESGIITVISARLDAAALGFPLQMYVAATLGRHDPRSTRIFEDQVKQMPQIIAADNVTGEMDYFLTVVARGVTELQHVLAAVAARGAWLAARCGRDRPERRAAAGRRYSVTGEPMAGGPSSAGAGPGTTGAGPAAAAPEGPPGPVAISAPGAVDCHTS